MTAARRRRGGSARRCVGAGVAVGVRCGRSGGRGRTSRERRPSGRRRPHDHSRARRWEAGATAAGLAPGTAATPADALVVEAPPPAEAPGIAAACPRSSSPCVPECPIARTSGNAGAGRLDDAGQTAALPDAPPPSPPRSPSARRCARRGVACCARRPADAVPEAVTLPAPAGRCRERPPAPRPPPRQRPPSRGRPGRRRAEGPRLRLTPATNGSSGLSAAAPGAVAAAGCGRRAVDPGRGEVPVVDEADHAVGSQRPAVGVGVDREAGVGVRADGVEHPAGVAGHHLDVVLEQHPVTRLGLVALADRVPAVVRLGVGHDGGDGGRRRVRVDPDVGPGRQREGVARPAADPALLADRLRRQLQREAGEGRARGTVVGTVQAGVIPDERLHLGRTAGPGDLQVVLGDVDDGRPQQRIAGAAVGAVPADRPGVHGRARLCRLLEGEQVQWHAGRRGHRRGRPWDEVEAR